MSKLYGIDFEYHDSQESSMNLVCAAISCKDYDKTYWLHDELDKERLIHTLGTIKESKGVLIAHQAGAESRSLIALGLNPMEFNWIDTKIEFSMLINHHPTYTFGRHLIDGKIKFITDSKERRYMTDEQVRKHNWDKAPNNLLNATYKMLGEVRSSAHKDEMRDIILTKDREKHEEHRGAILAYCLEDAKSLIPIFTKILEEYERCNNVLKCGISKEEILYRGSIGALSGVIENNGYPVAEGIIENFKNNCPKMIEHLQEDINSQFEFPFFNYNKGKYTLNRKGLQQIFESDYSHLNFNRTKTGISFDEDSLKKVCSKRQDFDRGNVVEQLVRFNLFKKSLSGFLPGKSSRNIVDDLGSDSRIRCWLNPYGSQTSRFQPPSSGFIPLKSRWMRSMIRSTKGNVIISVDYVSEEFLLSAILSKCKNMYEAYCSGDVYLHTAKLCGAIPMDGTKDKYDKERSLFKTIVLGLSFLIGAESLAGELSGALKRPVSKEEAYDYINAFYLPYKEYKAYMDGLKYKYASDNYAKLTDGWIMWGGNGNFRSSSNFPTQGMGAVILRKVLLSLSRTSSLKILFPLHDAVYIECPKEDVNSVLRLLNEVMIKAVVESFNDDFSKSWAKSMRLDGDIWGDTVGLNIDSPFPIKDHGEIYLPKGSEKDYDFFKKFFNKLDTNEKIWIA